MQPAHPFEAKEEQIAVPLLQLKTTMDGYHLCTFAYVHAPRPRRSWPCNGRAAGPRPVYSTGYIQPASPESFAVVVDGILTASLMNQLNESMNPFSYSSVVVT